jgi:mannose-6-phosphate isomerase-like protein (cupin superfamily)
MSNYTVCTLENVADAFQGKYPGEMRFYSRPLGTEQVAFTYRRMPPQTGGKGSYGHRHKTQEELYFVSTGRLQFKLDDDVVEAGPGTAVRVAPEVVRSVWNDGPDDAQLVIVSTRIEDLAADVETVEGFWPA